MPVIHMVEHFFFSEISMTISDLSCHCTCFTWPCLASKATFALVMDSHVYGMSWMSCSYFSNNLLPRWLDCRICYGLTLVESACVQFEYAWYYSFMASYWWSDIIINWSIFAHVSSVKIISINEVVGKYLISNVLSMFIYLCNNNIPYYSAYSWFNPALSTVYYYLDTYLFNPAHPSTPRGTYSPWCRNQSKGLISHKVTSCLVPPRLIVWSYIEQVCT
jgi:hypothetical protein